jgi:mRNA-degrading endonuclease toxin of MazEF toxin-antitoxin module
MSNAGDSPGQPPPPAFKTDTTSFNPAAAPGPAAAPAKPADTRKFYRGDIHIAYDVPTHGDNPNDIESKHRRVLIIQRDDITEKRHTITVLPLTTKFHRAGNTTVHVSRKVYEKMDQDSVILCDQFFSINKDRIGGKICRLTEPHMAVVTTKYRYIVNL